MGLPGMVLSAISALAGAIMYWGVTASSSSTVQQHGFRLSTLGIILMVAGAVGFVISAIVFSVSRKAVGTGTHSLDRQVVDTAGNASSVHEESK